MRASHFAEATLVIERVMSQKEKMSEKTPSLYMTKIPLVDEDDPKKQKTCSKPVLMSILAAILICFCIVLTVEMLYPVENRLRVEDIDEVHVFSGQEVDFKVSNLDVDNDKAPWHLDFLINPTRLCETVNPPDSEAYQKNPEVKLLMLVPSATGHFAQRRAIRRTWGSVAQEPQGPLRLGFVLGTTSNSTEADLIEQESVEYGDIIQADFEDTYRNLTTKSVLMLKWVSKHCAHAQYFLKADDDTFVNLHVIAQILQKDPYQSDDKFISGFIHKGAQPFRSPNEKYFVPEDDYPSEKYPPYASGSAYMSTGSTASQLYEASKRVKPFLSMEDIYVTGLCADDIDALLLHEPSFLFIDPPKPITWNSYKSYATAHSVSPDDIEQIWNEMTKSIFDTLGFPSAMDELMKFPGEDDSFGSMGSDTFSTIFVFPPRNSARGLFDMSSSDSLAQLMNLSGGKNLLDGLKTSVMSGHRADSNSGRPIIDLPETEVFNLTFFIRK